MKRIERIERMKSYLLPIAVTSLFLTGSAFPQVLAPNPTQQNVELTQMEETPVFSVSVVSRTTKAVNYRHRGGATKINMGGTPLLPESRAEAKVESKPRLHRN